MAPRPISISAITSASPGAGHQGRQIHHHRRIYQDIITKERPRRLSGCDDPGVPHVTNAIKEFVLSGNDEYDFVLVEIGGTVGDIEACRSSKRSASSERLPAEHAVYIHLTLLPFIPSAGRAEDQADPASVRNCGSIGIRRILLCRTRPRNPQGRAAQARPVCNVRESAVIERGTSTTSMRCRRPSRSRLDDEVLAAFGIAPKIPPRCRADDINERVRNPEGAVTIAIVGKYNFRHEGCVQSR